LRNEKKHTYATKLYDDFHGEWKARALLTGAVSQHLKAQKIHPKLAGIQVEKIHPEITRTKTPTPKQRYISPQN